MAKARHSGKDAGIQSQGCETWRGDFLLIKFLETNKLPSMALDTGIHADMTVLIEIPY